MEVGGRRRSVGSLVLGIARPYLYGIFSDSFGSLLVVFWILATDTLLERGVNYRASYSSCLDERDLDD